ncbi:MAG: GntR family transcriptional regulator [Deltaproteobacteria bacterium]|nr:GntR family transcriptional regulator [Deltaproteobacteria bacterium]
MDTILSKKQKKENCYQALKAQIVTGLLKPGNALAEQAVMEEFSIGRTPLRDVFLRIQNDGLIIRIPRGNQTSSGIICRRISLQEDHT